MLTVVSVLLHQLIDSRFQLLELANTWMQQILSVGSVSSAYVFCGPHPRSVQVKPLLHSHSADHHVQNHTGFADGHALQKG